MERDEGGSQAVTVLYGGPRSRECTRQLLVLGGNVVKLVVGLLTGHNTLRRHHTLIGTLAEEAS